MKTKQIKVIHESINTLLLCVIVFLIPFNQKYLSPIIALWCLSTLTIMIKEKLKFKLNQSRALLILFYFMLGVGVFWSNNVSEAIFDLEVKMSLFIFPFFLSFINYNKKQKRSILLSFYGGLIVTGFVLLYHALSNYSNSGLINDFFYSNLSPNLHPSYLSYYYVIGIVFLLLDQDSEFIESYFSKYLRWPAIVFFFLFNMLLLSKIGILTSVIMISFFTIRNVVKNRKYVVGSIIFASIFLVLYFSYQYSSFTKQRVQELVYGLTLTRKEYDNSSTAIRVKIWDQSIDLIKKKPILGHGTGDVKAVLMQSYLSTKTKSAYDKKLNAHNQFFQVAIALGIIGLTLFMSIFIFAIKDGLKNKNNYIVFFAIISILYMLPESVLENQAGTIFFGLFFALSNQASFQRKTLNEQAIS